MSDIGRAMIHESDFILILSDNVVLHFRKYFKNETYEISNPTQAFFSWKHTYKWREVNV